MFYANKLGLEEVTKRIGELLNQMKNSGKYLQILTKLASEGLFFGEAPEKDQRETKLSFNDSKNMGGV